jgi:hypothetical protein
MSAPPVLRRHLPAESVGPVTRLLPWLALFVRVSVGLGFLNAGLAPLISGGGRPGMIYGPMPGSGFLPGTEVLLKALPYLELALGLGLICGIFTTIMALISCGLVLLTPILMTLTMFTTMAASMGTYATGFGGMRGGMGLDFGIVSIAIAVISTPCFALLLLLSPQSINRFSLDAMIFPQDPIRPIDGPPPGPVELRIDEQGRALDENRPMTAIVAGPVPRQVYVAPRPAIRKRVGFAIVGWSAVAGVPIWAIFLAPLFYASASSDGSYPWPVGAVMTAAVLGATGWVVGNVVDRARGVL